MIGGDFVSILRLFCVPAVHFPSFLDFFLPLLPLLRPTPLPILPFPPSSLFVTYTLFALRLLFFKILFPFPPIDSVFFLSLSSCPVAP